jgi:predicted secreted protein
VDIVGYIAVYLVIWWVVLFAVLPFGVKSQHEAGEVVPGTEPGAPVRPRLLLKFLVTSAIAAVLWGLVVVLWIAGESSLRGE